MFSLFLNMVMQYGVAVSFGIVSTLVVMSIFSQGRHSKIRGYEIDIVKSRTRIMELQARNEQLERRLNEGEPVFIKDRLFLN